MRFLIAVLLALVIVPSAASATVQVGPLTLVGDIRPRHIAWAKQAQELMPLPRARIALAGEALFGGAEYDHIARTLYLPRGAGWSYSDQRVLFLHELGHVADFHQLSHSERRGFLQALGLSCGWWATHCYTLRYGALLGLPPGEMFAEQYAACALGMTRRQIEDAGMVSYGWLPNPALERTLCQLTARWILT